MVDKTAAPRTHNGIALTCPVCHHGVFFARDYLLNTRGLTFFNVDWANRSATAFVCERCDHILWFAKKREGVLGVPRVDVG